MEADRERARVLMVHPSAENYGADAQFLESVVALKDDFEVGAVVGGRGPLYRQLVALSVPTQAFEMAVLRKSALSPRGLLLLSLRLVVDAWRIIRILVAFRPTVVYVNTVTIPLWLCLARLTRTATVLHVHETVNESGALVNRALAAPLGVANIVIYNSHAAREAARAANRWAFGRGTSLVVYNGIRDDIPDGHPDRPEQGDVIALVGRISPRKGTDVAVRATALLRGRGNDVSLRIYGSVFAGYEWFEHSLHRECEQLGVSEHVEFMGFVDPVWHAFLDARVVIVPSIHEPFGNVAVEALMCARPVVASRTGGLAEIITDGLTGLLVEPGDAFDLADKIERFLLDAEFATAVAGRGRRWAFEQYGLDSYQDSIRSVLRTATAAR